MEIITRKIAKKKGLRRYFTGKPCVRGHIVERLVSNGNCPLCHKIFCETWDAQNDARYKAYRRKWRKNNPEKSNTIGRRWRVLKRKSIGNHSAKDIQNLCEKQKNRCTNCHVNFKKTGYHVDHIMPLSKGGNNEIKNLQLLCPRCNHKKSAKDPILWAQENGRLF